MSGQRAGYLNESSVHLTSYPPHSSNEEYKAPYTDLIDDYADPRDGAYRPDKVDPNALTNSQHPRRPSFPLGMKGSYASSRDSLDEESSRPRGYPPASVPPADTRTFWKKLLPDSLACRFYVLTIIIETTIDLAIEGDLLVRFHQLTEQTGQENSKMAVYLSIFALAHVFQLVMALDSVYNRNTLQFIFLTLFNALFLVYAVVQIGEIRAALHDTDVNGISHIPVNVLTTVIPIIISVSQLIYIGLGLKIYNEFGWDVYKFLGADRRIKKMYAQYQIFETLVKFDVFFWVGFSVQFIWLVLQSNNWEFYVTCAALPLSLVLLVEGHLAARHENKWMMATFMSGCVGALVYFVYKFVKVIVLRNTNEFKDVFKSLIIFSLIAIILLVATFVFAVILLQNFGRGLKTQMSKSQQAPKHNRYKNGSTHLQFHPGAGSGSGSGSGTLASHPHRMSID